VETVVSPKEVVLESLSYTASEVVGGRDESSPEPKGARRQWCGRRPKSGEAEEQRPEETVSQRLVTPRLPSKMLPQPKRRWGRTGGLNKRWFASRAKDGRVTVATKMWAQQHKIGRKARKSSQKQSTETRKREFMELLCP
jgi:hypothetical protein